MTRGFVAMSPAVRLHLNERGPDGTDLSGPQRLRLVVAAPGRARVPRDTLERDHA